MNLIKPGSDLPKFALPDVRNGRRVEYTSFLRKRRIVVLLLNDAGRVWFAEAAKRAREFAERDLTVLAITRSAEKGDDLPESFLLLHDESGAISRQLGETPAFYLVGKDTGVKIASRAIPSLPTLFRTIDAMPMRAAEMRERKG